MLTRLAIARREILGPNDYAIYCETLGGFARELLEPAIEHFIRQPKGEYEKPFPTTGDIAERCRQEATKRKPQKSRYCGHCRDGRIRLRSGEVVVCECVCSKCDSTGWLIVKANGDPWNPGDKEDRFARCCGCRRLA